jgi:hypothetical protein
MGLITGAPSCCTIAQYRSTSGTMMRMVAIARVDFDDLLFC